MKRIWIVGSSSGIGLELVKIFLNNNYKVIASSRNITKNTELTSLKEKHYNSLTLYDFDVSSNNNKKSIEEIFNIYGGLDIWFYNAGAYESMSIDEWNLDNFIKMNDINYLGAVKIMTHILPLFKKQKSAKWIWNLSLASIFGLPKGGGYSAPKAALLNLAQSIQPELKQINIELQVINHGFVKTKLTAKNSFEMPQLMEVEFAANEIFKKISKQNNFEIYFPFALSSFLKFLSFIPYKISLWITKKMIQ